MARNVPPVNLLFVSNYYPPEVNAPATRLAEHARVWSEDDHRVEILTAVPNFPEGHVHDGYRNRLTVEKRDGARVVRVPVYAAANRGTVRRSLSYGSFLASALLHARHLEMVPGVVVATSPQLLAGVAGARLARGFGTPFVLEVRDLWPDSIGAVGALPDGFVFRVLQRMERSLYRSADRIVVVSPAFVDELVARDVPRSKISVVPNGVDVATLPDPGAEERGRLRSELNLQDRFVAAYVGTLGMAHGVDVLLDAARRAADSADPADARLAFVIMGEGAERPAIEGRIRSGDFENVVLLDKAPREEALRVLAAADVSVVHLRDSDVFRKVIPSKIFEAMALGRPIALGVDGEARRVVEEAEAGAFFPPEDADGLLEVIRRLRDDAHLRERCSRRGPAFVREHFDRQVLARRYIDVLEDVLDHGRSVNAPAGARLR